MQTDLAPTIAQIRSHHRNRVFAMEQRKRADLATGAFLRVQMGWSMSLPAAQREKIRTMARQAMTKPETSEWGSIIEANRQSLLPMQAVEDAAHEAMEDLARQLPVWNCFAQNIRGFGAASLAVIVAEAGDLSGYDSTSKLRKRMGLAVIEGIRQGGLSKNAGADAWIAHGYNRKRRSLIWNIGEALIKGNGDGKYRTLYLKRLAIEHAKALAEGRIPATSQSETVESWRKRGLPALAKITQTQLKKNPERYRTAGHMSHRASRYMQQRLLDDLWKAWRGARRAIPFVPKMTDTTLPAARTPLRQDDLVPA